MVCSDDTILSRLFAIFEKVEPKNKEIVGWLIANLASNQNNLERLGNLKKKIVLEIN